MCSSDLSLHLLYLPLGHLQAWLLVRCIIHWKIKMYTQSALIIRIGKIIFISIEVDLDWPVSLPCVSQAERSKALGHVLAAARQGRLI